MKLNEYLSNKQFSEAKGLPEGDTILILDSTEVEEKEDKDDSGKPRTKYLIKHDGIESFVPYTVLKSIKTLQEKGAKKIRITRQGLDKTNTRYTTIAVQ